MENVLEYLYDAKTAFDNYGKKENIDTEKLERIYEYITRIEDLKEDEKQELDTFISENTFNEIHLATVYTNSERRNTLRNQIRRMIPCKVSKPSGNIYKLTGNITPLITHTEEKEIHVKSYSRKYRKKKNKNAN